jgi:hypothetical protein
MNKRVLSQSNSARVNGNVIMTWCEKDKLRTSELPSRINLSTVNGVCRVSRMPDKVDATNHKMSPRKLFLPVQHSPLHWFCFAVCFLQLWLIDAEVESQTKTTPVRTAYSALSAGIGTLWLTHEDGHFRKHGLDSSLI